MRGLAAVAQLHALEAYVYECAARANNPALPARDRREAALDGVAAASRLRQLQGHA